MGIRAGNITPISWMWRLILKLFVCVCCVLSISLLLALKKLQVHFVYFLPPF